MKTTRMTNEGARLQDEGALRIYEITKNMTREEELAYWAERTEALLRKQAALREASVKQAASASANSPSAR